tara:strand:+ start:841 stop:1290 length:450 start_codon:yes stop_codon:yes gene_type:complete
MASKSKLSQIFENSSKNLFDTMRYNWGIGYSEGEEVPRRNEGNVEIDLPPSKKSSKKSDRIKKIKEAIGKAGSDPASIYNAFKDQYDMAMQAGQVSFAGSKFRLGVRDPKMAGDSTFSSIKEAKASDYRAKHKERMKKFLIERAYTAKG